jgi:hypothetical protein
MTRADMAAFALRVHFYKATVQMRSHQMTLCENYLDAPLQSLTVASVMNAKRAPVELKLGLKSVPR